MAELYCVRLPTIDSSHRETCIGTSIRDIPPPPHTESCYVDKWPIILLCKRSYPCEELWLFSQIHIETVQFVLAPEMTSSEYGFLAAGSPQ